MLAASRQAGLEGIIAKRLDCPYTPGRRSSGWVKVKNVRQTDMVVGGWLEGERGRAGRVGALVVGYHDDGGLKYAGRVGTGFTDSELDRLGRILAPLARADSAFAGRQPPRETHWVDPVLVCVVEYLEWTQARTLRAPSYKGLRDDVDAGDVRFPADEVGSQEP
jgi:bifunctional non-homologous end joining protein LigD